MTVTLYTPHGEPFTVDDEDAPLVQRFNWIVSARSGKAGYRVLITVVSTKNVIRDLSLRMLLMGHPPQPEMMSVNIDGDPFNLKKSNLAWLDISTKLHRAHRPPGLQPYRGVAPVMNSSKWLLTTFDRKCFDTAEEAALAYDRFARERYGPWARVNFPRPDDPVPPGLSFPPSEGPLRAEDGSMLQVDPEFIPVLSRHQWKKGKDDYYAQIGKALRLPLALLILGKPYSGGNPVIHWQDGDKRNYTLCNLSWRRPGECHYRGVAKKCNRWFARIKSREGSRQIFSFKSPEEAAEAYDQASKAIPGHRSRLNFPEGLRKEGEAILNPSEPTRPCDSAIRSEVIRRKGNLTTVHAYLGRSAASPKCELTLPTELFASIPLRFWLQVEDALTHARYRVKLSAIAVEGRRLPVYIAQEIH